MADIQVIIEQSGIVRDAINTIWFSDGREATYENLLPVWQEIANQTEMTLEEAMDINIASLAPLGEEDEAEESPLTLEDGTPYERPSDRGKRKPRTLPRPPRSARPARP